MLSCLSEALARPLFLPEWVLIAAVPAISSAALRAGGTFPLYIFLISTISYDARSVHGP